MSDEFPVTVSEGFIASTRNMWKVCGLAAMGHCYV